MRASQEHLPKILTFCWHLATVKYLISWFITVQKARSTRHQVSSHHSLCAVGNRLVGARWMMTYPFYSKPEVATHNIEIVNLFNCSWPMIFPPYASKNGYAAGDGITIARISRCMFYCMFYCSGANSLSFICNFWHRALWRSARYGVKGLNYIR